jgi:hypothetical protein
VRELGLTFDFFFGDVGELGDRHSAPGGAGRDRQGSGICHGPFGPWGKPGNSELIAAHGTRDFTQF